MTNARSIEPRQTIDDLLARHKGNVPFFSAMRFLAASAVLVAHSILAAEGGQVAEPLTYLDHLGVLGLYIFFFISGFVITQSCMRSSPRSYLIRRAARIMPGLILVTLFCALLLGPLLTSSSASDYFTSSKFFQFFLNIAFVPEGELPGVFEHNTAGNHVNISLWTLRYEILCYVVILAVIAVGKFSTQLVAVMAVGLAILAHPAGTDFAAEQLQRARSIVGVDIAYLFREGVGIVSLFFAGSLYYFLRARIVINGVGFVVSAAVMAVALAGGLAFPLLPFTLGYAVIYLGFLDGRFGRLFQKNDYSYGMYIFAFPVQQSLAALSRNGMAWWMNLGLAFPIVLGLAALSWHLIERPSMRHARRLGGEVDTRSSSTEWRPNISHYSSTGLSADNKQPN
jgi:peptidoglycan/LPS O-acetylase OafA/YrhL